MGTRRLVGPGHGSTGPTRQVSDAIEAVQGTRRPSWTDTLHRHQQSIEFQGALGSGRAAIAVDCCQYFIPRANRHRGQHPNENAKSRQDGSEILTPHGTERVSLKATRTVGSLGKVRLRPPIDSRAASPHSLPYPKATVVVMHCFGAIEQSIRQPARCRQTQLVESADPPSFSRHRLALVWDCAVPI